MSEAPATGNPAAVGTAAERDGNLRRCARAAACALVCVLIWAAHTLLPTWVGEAGLEPSWVMGLAYAFRKHWQAGVDYVFTFGPWGYFSTNVYVSELYWSKMLLWEGAFKLCLAAVLTALVFRVRGVLGRVCFVLLLVYPMDSDAYTFVNIASIAVWVLGSERGRVRAACAGLTLLAVFLLVKFSYVAPVAACAFAILASHGKELSWRSAGALALGFAVLLALAWLSAGQSLFNVVSYLQRSLELSSGYSEGMSTPAPSGTHVLAFAIAGLLVFLAVLSTRTRSRAFAQAAWACASIPVLWVVYKAAFVRASDHTPIFFGFTLIAPLLVIADETLARPRKFAALASQLACVALSLVGLATAWKQGASDMLLRFGEASETMLASARAFVDPSALRAEYEAQMASGRAANTLPSTRAAVGSATIDMLSQHQALLLLNDLNWSPRPVFQSYATFTPRLMQLNADFYRSERAAEFILFGPATIDSRFPTADDALALQVIARDYEPVLIERTCLLLRHAPRPLARTQPQVIVDQELAFGQTLDLSALEGQCHLLRLDIRYTAWGRLCSFLDQAPPFFIEIDADSGATLRTRVVPSMMQADVIFDPLLGDRMEWKDWYLGEKLRRPRGLRIPVPQAPSLYEGSVRVTVLRADDVAPIPRAERRDILEASVLGTPPREVRAAKRLRPTFVGAQPGLLLAAPSEMHYDVSSGQHVLEFGFGVARRGARGDESDGVRFTVTLRQAGASDRVLFERFLDPVRNAQDREPQRAELRFQLLAPASLILATDPGPSGDATGDFSAWTHVALE